MVEKQKVKNPQTYISVIHEICLKLESYIAKDLSNILLCIPFSNRKIIVSMC